LVPYDNASPDSPEDAFNYVHSSARIAVECAFGEIDHARWGILWRPLKFNLKEHRYVIDACMQLHNFILDFKEEHPDEETQGDEDMEFFHRNAFPF
jgi:Plant transposon protein.